MDSLAMQVPINRSMILQMAQIYQAPNNQSTLSVKVLHVQQQNGYTEIAVYLPLPLPLRSAGVKTKAKQCSSEHRCRDTCSTVSL